QGTKAHWAWYERHRWDRKPWVKNSKDHTFDDLYNTGKDLWAKYQDASDEYDWEILAFEVEECPTTRIEDEYQYYLREVVDRFKDWIEYNGDLSKTPSRKELADLIRAYKEDRNAEIIPTPSGHETMRLDKGKAREIPEERPKTDMEREWEAANGIIDEFDDEYFDELYQMAHSKIARALPTRPDIKELQFSGAHFSRGAIARLGQRLQSQYPNCKFQILLSYENWKPGGWTSGNEPVSLFSLLDHYDEAQLPDDADPDYFERFIIYIRDAPPTAGGCNGELNDCLYECLKYIYGTFSKMPKSIEKPEYIKKALGLNRDAPVPVSCMDKVEQLAGSLALNIMGDITRISKSKSDRRATLILSEGHYSLALNPGRLHPSKLDRKRNLPIVYHENGVNNMVTIYNGKTVKSCTIGQFQKVRIRVDPSPPQRIFEIKTLIESLRILSLLNRNP
ncbi:hypothetical protein RhiirA4_461426, partial [Rhizophagus irregularis]